jgi:uncharacterized membrane protein
VPDLPEVRSPRWAWWITFPLSVIGLGLAIYLTYEHFTGSTSLVCSESSKVNCLKVTTSSQSEIFGHIPVALVGLVYFAIMVVLTSPWAWRATAPWIAWLRIAFVAGPMGMVIYLVYVEAVQLKAICLYCTGVHLITFLLFLTVLAAYLLRPLDPIEA